LSVEVEQAGALLFSLQRLLLELTGWLQGMDAGVQRLGFTLWHRENRRTDFRLGLHEPGRDLQQFTLLLRERLERLRLQEPVVEVGLRADSLQGTRAQTTDWFGKSERQNPVVLLDRLRARLGDEAVCGLGSIAEHRPEYAWSYSREPSSGGEICGLSRPLWLLPVPRQLQTRNGRPCLQGLLLLEPGRERIESGWWDEQDVARDYFVATNPGGSCYWVYREIGGKRRWFLHGIFE
jgi:protein ImuB